MRTFGGMGNFAIDSDSSLVPCSRLFEIFSFCDLLHLRLVMLSPAK